MKPTSMVRAAMAAACGFLAISQAAFAAPGIAVTYAPVTQSAASIPTLSQWGLALLSLALVVVMYRTLRKAANGRPIAGLMLAGALALAMGSAGDWISLSFAGADGAALSNKAGGTILVSDLTIVGNTSGVTQQIIKIEVPSGFTAGAVPNGLPAACAVGTTLAANESCTVSYRPPL
ncbi:midcut-by-XrtH protein [Paracidovorax avenae]|uniref:midcut-by-XrtH protein n=1 Tax=Paracidovorax avenae TaxID=80867 RepID=UPI001F466C9D|nr:midcut-by-XrtH protein [Paracidovorax avenae]